jgi:micrococcal nuclease
LLSVTSQEEELLPLGFRITILFLLVLSPGTEGQCRGTATCFTGNVTKVVDGDTIDVNGIRIRLSLIDTPERGKEHFLESTRLAEKLCPVGSLALVDQDDGQKQGSYGRMIGKVFCNYDKTNQNLTKNLNQEMIKSGYAKIATKHCVESEFANETWATTYGCQAILKVK